MFFFGRLLATPWRKARLKARIASLWIPETRDMVVFRYLLKVSFRFYLLKKPRSKPPKEVDPKGDKKVIKGRNHNNLQYHDTCWNKDGIVANDLKACLFRNFVEVSWFVWAGRTQSYIILHMGLSTLYGIKKSQYILQQLDPKTFKS